MNPPTLAKRLRSIPVWLIAVSLCGANPSLAAPSLSKAELGQVLFHDTALSNPLGQSCASCHKPDQAFADPGQTLSKGAQENTLGARNSPSLTYVGFIPKFEWVKAESRWAGGLFWDGRANTLEEQALSPLTNPKEMNNTLEGLAKTLRNAPYYSDLVAHYPNATQSNAALVQAVTKALAEFQTTPPFQPFTSKYDYYEFGLVELTEQELKGFEVFNDKGKCTDCHAKRVDGYELFSKYRHHNILTPANPDIAHDSEMSRRDLGLANNPNVSTEQQVMARGLFRTPTLRNIQLTPPYMHNGALRTLEEVVDFYNDVHLHGPPEVTHNPSKLLQKKLNLSQTETRALVAFLKTLTDGYEAPKSLENTLREKQEQRAIERRSWYQSP